MSQTQTQLFGQGYWGGICGFVSVIHGMLLYKGGDGLNGLSQAELEYNLGTSMLAFLRHIRSNKAIADQIVDFTRSFGGNHANKTLEQLISECEVRVNNLMKPGSSGLPTTGEEGWGIGMTKDALIEYIRWIGLSHAERGGVTQFSQSSLRNLKNCVIGVGSQNDVNNGFGGLRHWVYVNEAGVLYNWGKETRMQDSTDRPYPEYPDRHNIVVSVLELRR